MVLLFLSYSKKYPKEWSSYEFKLHILKSSNCFIIVERLLLDMKILGLLSFPSKILIRSSDSWISPEKT